MLNIKIFLIRQAIEFLFYTTVIIVSQLDYNHDETLSFGVNCRLPKTPASQLSSNLLYQLTFQCQLQGFFITHFNISENNLLPLYQKGKLQEDACSQDSKE